VTNGNVNIGIVDRFATTKSPQALLRASTVLFGDGECSYQCVAYNGLAQVLMTDLATSTSSSTQS
jgi:hypothetical protein